MSRIRSVGLSMVFTGLLLSASILVPGMGVMGNAAAAEETVRPELGKSLQAAQDLIKHQEFKEALAKIHVADGVGNKTPYENFIIERMRGAAAGGAGDPETAAKSFEAAIASGRLSPDEQLKMMEAVVANH